MGKKSRKLLWPDEETWLGFFRDAFRNDPERAEQVARIWNVLLEHLAEGPEGVRHARRILRQAQRSTYPFTLSYRLAYKHIKLSLSGQVQPDDEPLNLLRDSIRRARASIEESRKLEG
ncbi:MAG TPA: hypothetical protein VEZ90_03025 [Blastocatellia bacterium]|nr:hypothetical protein [Blastocatellia bacterium]